MRGHAGSDPDRDGEREGLKLHVRDTKHVVVIGADAFSCKWAYQNAAVNYRETGEGTGEVVSVELQ